MIPNAGAAGEGSGVTPFETLSSLLSTAPQPGMRATALDAPGSDLYASGGKWAGDPGRFASDTDANYVAYLAAIAAGSAFPAPEILVGPTPATAVAMSWGGVALGYIRSNVPRNIANWNIWALLGDSITFQSFAFSLCAIRGIGGSIAGKFGYPGYTSAQVLAKVGDVITSGAGRCLIMVGSNDIDGGTAKSVTQANVTAIANALYAAGIVPIFALVPPRVGYYSAVFGRNEAIRRGAYGAGARVISPWDACVNAADGSWLSAAYHLDGTHPSPLGASIGGGAAKTQIQASSDLPILSVCNVGGSITNGCFVLDTNADGLADNWTANAGLVCSLDAGDHGNKQTIAYNLASGSLQFYQQDIACTSGNKYRFSGKVTSAIGAVGRWSLYFLWQTAAGATLATEYIETNQECPGSEFILFAEKIAPATATKFRIVMLFAGASNAPNYPAAGSVSLERFQVLDLTSAWLS